LVNLSLSHVDNLTPRFKAVTDIDKLFAVCMFGLHQFIPASKPNEFVCLTGLKDFL